MLEESTETATAPESTDLAVRFDGVRHFFGERNVLAGITLSISERRVGIVGANGSGKSTLARMINGLIRPTEGSVTVRGLDVGKHGRAVRRLVGFVFTNADNQIVMPTVAEDVAFSLRRSELGKSEVAVRVAEMLETIGLAEFADHPAHLLSEGQKQMLALAGVLIREPAIVVADEPTTLLDLRNARRMAQALDDLDQQLIVVTHQLEFLAGFERVIVLDHGAVVADGTPDDSLRHYRELIG